MEKWLAKKLSRMEIYKLADYLPSVIKPEHKISFGEKIKWTALMLVLFYVLGSIIVWGVDTSRIAQFEFLEIVFGSKFGSLITLGIGPIVTASIILQLLTGSKILNWDTKTPEGKAKFMGTQKILAISFCILEGAAYVLAGAVPPVEASAFFTALLIFQLTLGGIIIIFMDEVVSKWGIGSGISLFIVAGVAKTIIVSLINPLAVDGSLPTIENPSIGLLPSLVTYAGGGQLTQGLIALFPLISTLAVFAIVLFAQGMKIEIPMAITMPFGKFGARRWPLKFIYTSNIPVILTAAVLANLQVLLRSLSSSGLAFLGTYDRSGVPLSGLGLFVSPPNSASLMVAVTLGGIFALLFGLVAAKVLKKFVLRSVLLGGVVGLVVGMFFLGFLGLPSVAAQDWSRMTGYASIMIIGSVIFSMFWVGTAGMDAKSVAEQFKSSFLSLPGFRRDPRIVEDVLSRYIPAVTVLGGAFVGLLAGFADMTNAIGTGTGILLTVMIFQQLYDQIMQQHSEDLPPVLKKFIGQ